MSRYGNSNKEEFFFEVVDMLKEGFTIRELIEIVMDAIEYEKEYI